MQRAYRSDVPATSPPAPRPLRFAPREINVERRADGALILRSPIAFNPPDWTILDFLPDWAKRAPDRVFLGQRDREGGWETITYAETLQRVRAVAGGLLSLGARSGARLVILSGNSIEHALIYFAAMTLGMVVAPVSPNYTLMPGGLVRLREIADLMQPDFVFAQNAEAFAAARSLSALATATWIVADPAPDTVHLASLYTHAAGPSVDQAWARVDSRAPAKILFTSGSTGSPKGVINTHRMMASGLQMSALMVAPDEAPVQVEWLPWHHTMGSNVILHGVLKAGGSLYIDDGRPVPALFPRTIANLREISPTAMFNVPGGYALLCQALEADAALMAGFFSRLRKMTYAGAAIPRATLDKLYELSERATGQPVPVMAGYGTTETAPTISTTHWASRAPGELGLPAPGLELKLLPTADSYEARIRGPNVTEGYFGQPELSARAFDEEGFYRIGDTVDFIDRDQPALGLRFVGRLSENFKLANGTWVVVGELRARLVNAAAGVLTDLVIAGENREACAVLAWLNPVAAKAHATGAAGAAAGDPAGALHEDPGVLAHLRACFERHNASRGSSETVHAITLLLEPPSLADGEITDKAYVNQRAVLKRRAAQVESLYAAESGAQVLRIGAGPERQAVVG